MSSFLAPTPLAPNIEYTSVEIEDVDIPNRVAHVRDRTQALIQARFNEQGGGSLSVPMKGQIWIAIRRGFTWYLDKRIDTSDDIISLSPGDVRISADSSVVFTGGAGAVNGNPWGATIHDHYLNPSSGFTSVVLTRDPVGITTIHPYLNGLEVMPNLWKYDEPTRTITFATEIGDLGNLLVKYETWQPPLDDAATVVGKGYITAIEEFIDV